VRFQKISGANWAKDDYVLFTDRKPGCFSNSIGVKEKNGGSTQTDNVNVVNVPEKFGSSAKSCTTGVIAHELGHILGLYHEHNRLDRNQFVKIHWDRISQTAEEDYKWRFCRALENAKHSSKYDFGSIMHYPAYAFHKKQECRKDAALENKECFTIEPLKTADVKPNELGQRDAPSDDDIAAINELYPPIEVLPAKQSVDVQKQSIDVQVAKGPCTIKSFTRRVGGKAETSTTYTGDCSDVQTGGARLGSGSKVVQLHGDRLCCRPRPACCPSRFRFARSFCPVSRPRYVSERHYVWEPDYDSGPDYGIGRRWVPDFRREPSFDDWDD
jgi:hypothetical protein